MSAKLIHATFVKDEAHCIGRMLDSILPFVSESYVLIDDRTTDETAKIAEDHGCHINYFKFNNFGKAQNTKLSWVSGKSDWIFGLASDEIILPDFGKEMLELIEQIHNSDIDGIYHSRMHWYDLEMTWKKEWNYPDWQQRLIRNDYPRIHVEHYVHATLFGIRRSMWIKKDIQHFNVYWKDRIPYVWDEMNDLYDELAIRGVREGWANIWP